MSIDLKKPHSSGSLQAGQSLRFAVNEFAVAGSSSCSASSNTTAIKYNNCSR
jgi:hypothetical protein